MGPQMVSGFVYLGLLPVAQGGTVRVWAVRAWAPQNQSLHPVSATCQVVVGTALDVPGPDHATA